MDNYSYRTRSFMVFLDAKQSPAKAEAQQASPPSDCTVALEFQVDHRHRFCSRPLGGSNTVDHSVHVSRKRFFRRIHPSVLLQPETTSLVLSDTISSGTAGKWGFLHRYMSAFSHHAAAEAMMRRKGGGGELSRLIFRIKIDSMFERDIDQRVVPGLLADAAAGVSTPSGCCYCSTCLSALSNASESDYSDRCLPELCPICLDALCPLEGRRVTILPCFHVFHDDCLRVWRETRSCCPVCRSED